MHYKKSKGDFIKNFGSYFYSKCNKFDWNKTSNMIVEYLLNSLKYDFIEDSKKLKIVSKK